MLLEQAEMQSRFDTELKDTRQRHEGQVRDLDEKVSTLSDKNTVNLDTKRDHETTIKELTANLERREYEL